MPGAGGQPPQRTTFRPPWVKDGPPPIPMPAAPWTLNARKDSKTSADDAPAFTKVTLKSVPKPADAKPAETKSAAAPTADSRKTSKVTIVPSQPKSDKKTGQPPSPAPSKTRENGRPEPSSRPQLERQTRVERSRSRGDQIPLSKSESTTGAPTLSKSASRANIPPPPPPRPPPPPPSRTILKDLAPLSAKAQKTIDMLKSRPRKRPDWACMMKEVESGKKLRHVVCNDRSAPLIERVITKVTADPAGDAHFVFDSEKSNVHNKLLKQIQEGVKLKSVKTNDRSRPVLEGLRKFRRQLTIEEQMQKAEKAPIDEAIPDEMDDIDAVRDDLQSTKQMLALELRNKEALERENKRLQTPIHSSPEQLLELELLQQEQFRSQARILNLEVELEQAKSQKNVQENKQQDQQLANSLKKEAEQARKDAERLEKDFASAAEERDKAKNELEDMKRMYANLEKRMKADCKETNEESVRESANETESEYEDETEDDETEHNDSECENEPIVELAEDTIDVAWWDVSGMALAGCPSAKDVARIASQKSMDKPEPEESEEEEEETSEEESEEDEDPKVAEEKRQQREIKMMKTKIRNFKDKTVNSKKERQVLKDQIKQQQKLVKEENKKFKALQKEVDKMAKLMAGDEEEDEEDEDDEEEETESEEESESEESEDDDDSETDDESAPVDKRKPKLQGRVKRHEGRLAALKKGNYLLKAQVDRLKDDLAKQRVESASLQQDLDSVLAELG